MPDDSVMLLRYGIMRPKIHQFVVAVATCAFLAGCAGSSDQYPSLAIRDAERVSGQFSPSPPTEEIGPVREFSTQEISGLVAAAQESHQAFLDAQLVTGRLVSVARGSGAESEARALALVALADLSTKRSNTAIALADLDLLAAKAATELLSSEQLATAQTTVLELVNRQDSTLAQLWEQLER